LNSTNSELRITPEKAKSMVESGQALFLDVVSSSVYPLIHKAITGAIRIAPEELADRVEELPKSTTIITYCTWLHEETSARAALMLRDKGFLAVALKGGFQAWNLAGFAVETKEVEQATTLGKVCRDCGRPLSEHVV
jgi:rhodanese-related sulfurtransferase